MVTLEIFVTCQLKGNQSPFHKRSFSFSVARHGDEHVEKEADVFISAWKSLQYTTNPAARLLTKFLQLRFSNLLLL